MNKSKKWFAWLILFLAQLTGCTTMNSKFDCPMKSGIRCESLDQVNSRVDRGEMGHETWVNARTSSISYQNTNHALSKGEPIRMRETVLPIWIAPYEDTGGNYHEESEVFTIIKPGYWKGNPPKVISSNED